MDCSRGARRAILLRRSCWKSAQANFMTDLYPFSTSLKVRFNETDAQGHVNFSWFLNYFDVALIEYLRALGYSYNQMLEDGLDMLYIDAHAAYASPAYFD